MKDKDKVSEKDISKEPIICFVVIQRRDNIHIQTLKYDWQGLSSVNSEIELAYDDSVLAVIPAPEKSYEVKGLLTTGNDIDNCNLWGDWVTLGYEFKGATHPDWKELLLKERKHRD